MINFGTTELDTALANMEKSMSEQDFWNASAYASEALRLVESGALNPEVESTLGTEELTRMLTSVRDTADNVLAKEKAKRDLIEEIVNFKG